MIICGERFRRVYQYGKEKVRNLPPEARERALTNHIKLWICSSKLGRTDEKVFKRMKIGYIEVDGSIVGVNTNV